MHRGVISTLALAMAAIFIIGCSGDSQPAGNTSEADGKTLARLKNETFKSVKDVEKTIMEMEDPKKEESDQEKPEESPSPPGDSQEDNQARGSYSGRDALTGLPYEKLIAVVETTKGVFKMKFYHDTAPNHVENFIKLARERFYDGLTFHRYVDRFVIQGGDPEGTGAGGPGYNVPAEINLKHKHTTGAVAAARRGDDVNPGKESSGSQFYICLEPLPELDGEYTVWGQVTQGMDVVKKLRQGDKMKKIEIREKK